MLVCCDEMRGKQHGHPPPPSRPGEGHGREVIEGRRRKKSKRRQMRQGLISFMGVVLSSEPLPLRLAWSPARLFWGRVSKSHVRPQGAPAVGCLPPFTPQRVAMITCVPPRCSVALCLMLCFLCYSVGGERGGAAQPGERGGPVLPRRPPAAGHPPSPPAHPGLHSGAAGGREARNTGGRRQPQNTFSRGTG